MTAPSDTPNAGMEGQIPMLSIRAAVALFADGDYWVMGYPGLGPTDEEIREDCHMVLEKTPVAIFILEAKIPNVEARIRATIVG